MFDMIGGVGCWGIVWEVGVGGGEEGRYTCMLEIAYNVEDTKTPPSGINYAIYLFYFLEPPPSGINYAMSLIYFLEPPPSGINYAMSLIYPYSHLTCV